MSPTTNTDSATYLRRKAQDQLDSLPKRVRKPSPPLPELGNEPSPSHRPLETGAQPDISSESSRITPKFTPPSSLQKNKDYILLESASPHLPASPFNSRLPAPASSLDSSSNPLDFEDDRNIEYPPTKPESGTPSFSTASRQDGEEEDYTTPYCQWFKTSDSDDSDLDMTVSSSQVKTEFEKQKHFYNNPAARVRGNNLIQWAKNLLAQPRGSPSAKDKIDDIQDITHRYQKLGESDFSNAILNILINQSRMVLKQDPTRPPESRLTIHDFEPDPRAWKDDYLGRRTNVTFDPNAVPQMTADPKTLEGIFKAFPKLRKPIPDVVWALSEELLMEAHGELCSIFDGCGLPRLTKQLYFPFLSGDFKTEDRPVAEAENQCVRAGSSIVWHHYQWNQIAAGQPLPKYPAKMPPVSSNDTSTPDADSACFSVAIAPQCTEMHLNWREEFSNGAVYWHTTPLETYDLRPGFPIPTERFQKHISNVLDWGVGERAVGIYKQARALAKRKTNEQVDIAIPDPKRQRTG